MTECVFRLLTTTQLPEVNEHQMIVCATGNKIKPMAHKAIGHGLRVVNHLLDVSEGRRRRIGGWLA